MEPVKKSSNNRIIITLGIIIAITIVIVLTALLVPQGTNPAYAAAIAFTNAASSGDDDTAFAKLSPELQTYVEANCDGSVSACINAYIPPEWGGFTNAVFRRAMPDGQTAWDIQLVATYEEGQGFSGICIYNRAEQQDDEWRITAWSGWISCDDPNSGLSGLMAEDAQNRVP